jgi:putative transposase
MHSAGQPATTKPGDRCGIVGAKGCDGQPIDQHCQLGARGAKPSRFAVGDSEDGAFWTAFLRSLKARGLQGVQLVIADAHLGLRQAVQATMAGAAIQRCRVHFLRDVLASAPKGSAEMVAAAIRTIFAQPDATHVHEQLDVIAGMLGRQFPKLETMLRDAGEELLAFTSFPISHGRRSGPPIAWSD